MRGFCCSFFDWCFEPHTGNQPYSFLQKCPLSKFSEKCKKIQMKDEEGGFFIGNQPTNFPFKNVFSQSSNLKKSKFISFIWKRIKTAKV